MSKLQQRAKITAAFLTKMWTVFDVAVIRLDLDYGPFRFMGSSGHYPNTVYTQFTGKVQQQQQ